MSQNLQYGYVVPTTGDKGSSFWTLLTNFLTQLSSHNHDGSNSAPLSSAAVQPISGGTIAASSWSDQGGGTYRALVTVPTGRTFANIYPVFRVADTGPNLNTEIYPTLVRYDDFNFYVYVNDPTMNLNVIYVT